MGATSKATLKTFFETGDIPSQSEFADFVDSSENIVDENLLISATDSIADVTPAVQATATPLTTKLNLIETTNAVIGGVKLPAALKGRLVYIGNSGTYSTAVFPSTGDAFLGQAADASYTLARYGCLVCFCPKDGIWLTSYYNVVYQPSALQGTYSTYSDVTPAAQGTATPLLYKFNGITGTNATRGGVLLPAFALNESMYVANRGTYSTAVYPAVGCQIVGNATNAAVVLQPNDVAIFYAISTVYVGCFIYNAAKPSLTTHRCVVSQAGVAAPTSVVLENTLGGTLVWARTGVGVYTATLNGALPTATLFCTSNVGNSGVCFITVRSLVSPNSIEVRTYNGGGFAADGILTNFFLSISVNP